MKLSGKIYLNIVQRIYNLYNVDSAILPLRKIVKCISGCGTLPFNWKNQVVRCFLTDLMEVFIIVISDIQTNKV
jgi:hypothetical protein